MNRSRRKLLGEMDHLAAPAAADVEDILSPQTLELEVVLQQENVVLGIGELPVFERSEPPNR